MRDVHQLSCGRGVSGPDHIGVKALMEVEGPPSIRASLRKLLKCQVHFASPWPCPTQRRAGCDGMAKDMGKLASLKGF